MPVAKSFNPNTPSPSIPANLMPPPERKPSPRGEGAEAAKPAKRPVGRPRKHVDENAVAAPKRPVERPPKRKNTDDDEDEVAQQQPQQPRKRRSQLKLAASPPSREMFSTVELFSSDSDSDEDDEDCHELDGDKEQEVFSSVEIFSSDSDMDEDDEGYDELDDDTEQEASMRELWQSATAPGTRSCFVHVASGCV